MSVIIGLGNPGQKYAGTRHNVGFDLIDRLATAQSVNLGPGKGPFLIGTSRINSQKVMFVKPTTFMNKSGDAVQQVLNWYKLTPEECLVCYDDLDIDIGSIRLRAKGSAGGHNGIKDIIQKLGTKKFPRLRIGIGGEFARTNQVNYVLSKFSPDERENIDHALDRAEDAVFSFIRDGIEQAMNTFN